jgi:hypothetical protein
MELSQFRWSILPFVFVILSAVLEFVAADMLAESAFPFATEQKLLKMEEQLGSDAINRISSRLSRAINQFRACDKSQVSATVHLLVELNDDVNPENRSGLIQLTNYVGPHGGTKGRSTRINQGVIGRCARTHVREYVDFANADEYSDRMVREFGFTKSQTERHTKTGRSYLAYPLKNGTELLGILYYFTTEPQIFPLAAKHTNLDEIAREIVDDLHMARLV